MNKEKLYCIYRHLTPSGLVFYIGISDNIRRPYNKKDRSSEWKEFVKNNPDYEIQILTTGLSEEDAIQLEIMLIAYYKRIDCCGGTLINLTDGGKATNGRIMADWQKVYLSDLKKEGHKNGTLKINLDGVYKGIKERNRRWEENPQLKLDMASKVSEKISKFNILKIDRKTDEILESYETFPKLKEIYPNVGKTVVYSVCNGSKKSYLGYIWRYQDKNTLKIIEPNFPPERLKKEVINKDLLIIYDSCTFVANFIGMKRETLSAKLTGRNRNNTSYQYLEDFLKENPDFDILLFTYYKK